MSWLFEDRTYRSDKNGTIVVRRRFGVWSVYVEGCEQTGPAVHRMWKVAYGKVKRFLTKNPQKILLLGLGAGGEIAMVRNLFPDAAITVIEFVHYANWPEFDFIATIPRILRPEKIDGATLGTRWTLWPLSFEQYVGDAEPSVAPVRRGLVQITLWHRLVRNDTPPGWRAATHLPYRTIGFSELSGQNYFQSWSPTARRSRRQWLEKYLGTSYRIRSLTLEEFVASYRVATVNASTRRLIIKTDLLTRYKKKKSTITFWGVERISDGTTAAGIAVIDSPSCQGSYYLAGFQIPASKKDPVMTGLFDYWFHESQKKGLRFLHFGDFWQPTKPESWRGFSSFKGKFNPQYLVQPPVLYRVQYGLSIASAPAPRTMSERQMSARRK